MIALVYAGWIIMKQDQRIELAEPGPMLPPVPAIILGVKGVDFCSRRKTTTNRYKCWKEKRDIRTLSSCLRFLSKTSGIYTKCTGCFMGGTI